MIQPKVFKVILIKYNIFINQTLPELIYPLFIDQILMDFPVTATNTNFCCKIFSPISLEYVEIGLNQC